MKFPVMCIIIAVEVKCLEKDTLIIVVEQQFATIWDVQQIK